MENKKSLHSGLLSEAQKRAVRDKKIQQFIIIFGGLLSLCAVFSADLCYFWNSFSEGSIFVPIMAGTLVLFIVLWLILPLGRVDQERVDYNISQILIEKLGKYCQGERDNKELQLLSDEFRGLG